MLASKGEGGIMVLIKSGEYPGFFVDVLYWGTDINPYDAAGWWNSVYSVI